MLELARIFFDNIVPILIIAGVGFWIGKRFELSPKPAGTLIFYAFSPALVFNSLYTSQMSGGEFAALYAATVLFQVIMAGIAYLALRLQGADALQRAAVIVGVISLNAGNYGLSLVSFAFGPEVLSRAVVVFVANVTMNYSLGIYIASNGRSSGKEALFNVLKTPAVYGVIGAFLFRGLEIHLPLALERSVSLLADAAIPMMLVLLGLQLGQVVQISSLKLVATGVGLRLLASPFLAAGLAQLFAMNRLAATAFIMLASMPTAVLTIIITTEYDLDRNLSLNLIFISTLLSPITLSVLILMLR